MISNGKKCHYVQIGIELFHFTNLEDAKEFVAGKGLVADPMSMDFGVQPTEATEPVSDEDADTIATDDVAAEDAEA